MPPQTQVTDLTATPYAAGQPIGGEASGIDMNFTAGGHTEKVAEFTVDTVTNDADYAVTVPRSDGANALKTINAGPAASASGIRDLLIAAIVGDAEVAGRVVAFSSDTNKFKVAGFEPGDDFPISEADAKLSLAITQAASEGEDIPFGAGVMAHPTNPHSVRLPVVDGAFIGVALRTPSVESAIDGTTVHKSGTGLPVRLSGAVPVPIDDDYTPALGDSVFLRYTADANGARGNFRGDADTDEAIAVSNCMWLAAGAFNGLGGRRLGLLFIGRDA